MISKRPSVASVAKGAAVVAASLALAFSNSPASSAETGWIYVQGGKARWDSLNRLQYCHTGVDRQRVPGQPSAYVGGTVYLSGWAPSHSCNPEGPPTSIHVFRVRPENIGCSAWYHR